MAAHGKLHASEHAYSGLDDAHAYIDHGEIQGLSDDDHSQYALLVGRAGGQTLIGGTAAGDDLVLESTSNATKGDVAVKNATDLVIYSDNLSTEKARIDGATGNITTSGTVDGVDVATLKSDYDTHSGGNAKAQHTGGLGDHTHQSSGAEGAKIDHGLALNGLGDDDHTQYALLAGRSGGQTLIGGTDSGDDLTLSSTSHGTKGQILVQDSLDMNSKKITGLDTPTTSTDAANKDYVDSASQGLDWQESVLDKDLATAPGGPSTGDRYIIGISDPGTGALVGVVTGTKTFSILGDWSAHIAAGDKIHIAGSTGNDAWYTVTTVTWNDPNTDVVVSEVIPDATVDGSMYWAATGGTWATEAGPHKIAEYNGASWDYTTPDDGFACWVEDEDNLYVFNSADLWVRFGSTVNHNNLSGLQGGSSEQYYHLTSAQRTDLTDGGDCGIHKHDDLYYLESEFTETDQDAVKPVKTQANGHLDHTLVKEIYHTAKGAGIPSPSEGEVVIWYEHSDYVWLLFGTDTNICRVELSGA